jgi:tetratricopeptide (TPR) repeat protein
MDTAQMLKRTTLSMTLLLAFGCSLGVGNAFAQSLTKEQRQAVQDHTNAGVKFYNIRRFDEAIAEFEKAYEIVPDPTLLYNMGLAHMKNSAPEKALFSFQRYQQMAPANDKDRPGVIARIKELQATIEKDAQKAQAAKIAPAPLKDATTAPPIEKTSGGPRPERIGPPPTRQAVASADLHQSPPNIESSDERRIRVAFAAGMAQPAVGVQPAATKELKLDAKTLFSASAAVLYAVPLSVGALDIGLAGSWSPISYVRSAVGREQEERSNLLGLLATAGLRYEVGRSFFLGPAAGAGVVWWTGLGAGNPITGGKDAGTTPMLSFRGALSAVWALAPSAFLGFDLGATYSKPSGVLGQYISSLTRVEANAAVGFAF